MVVELFQALGAPEGKKKQESFVFFKKGAESPQQLGLWFDPYYKRWTSVFENEMKTASYNPFCCFTKSWGSWAFQCSEASKPEQQKNVFIHFYLTCQLPTKSKRRLKVRIRTVTQVGVRCTTIYGNNRTHCQSFLGFLIHWSIIRQPELLT